MYSRNPFVPDFREDSEHASIKAGGLSIKKNITHAAASFAVALVFGGFSNLPAKADAALTVNADTAALTDSDAISPLFYGIFFEDINFSVDGGMYWELIKNGSFEYGMPAKNSGKHNYSLSNNETVSASVCRHRQ